jgi:response regulator RpfG family c-di-GMP phosphodiesterase
MAEKVLFVDDDRQILEAYQFMLGREFAVEIAVGGMDAQIALASQGPFAVIVSDLRMPGMDGIELLQLARERSPDTIRIMLTGNANMEAAMEAVNEGNIFRFLAKPCSTETLAKALRAALQQYRLVMAEKELLSKTLSGSIQLLTEVLSMVNPTAFGRSARVRRLAGQLAAALRLENTWEVEIAAMLSQLGCITIPEETLQNIYQGNKLDAADLKWLQSYPQIGHDLLRHIPRMEVIAEIIAYQEKLFNGGGVPQDERRGANIPLGARILKLALDYDKLIESHLTSSEALKELQGRPNWYDPFILAALETVLAREVRYEPRWAHIHELKTDMILAEDIVSLKGMLLIKQGQEVTRSLCLRLNNFRAWGAITEPIKVLAPVVGPVQAAPQRPGSGRLDQRVLLNQQRAYA